MTIDQNNNEQLDSKLSLKSGKELTPAEKAIYEKMLTEISKDPKKMEDFVNVIKNDPDYSKLFDLDGNETDNDNKMTINPDGKNDVNNDLGERTKDLNVVTIDPTSEDLAKFMTETPLANNDAEYLNIFKLDPTSKLNWKGWKDKESKPITYTDVSIQNLTKRDRQDIVTNLGNLLPNKINEANADVIRNFLIKYLSIFPNWENNTLSHMEGGKKLMTGTLSLQGMIHNMAFEEKRDDIASITNIADINKIKINGKPIDVELNKSESDLKKNNHCVVDGILLNLQNKVKGIGKDPKDIETKDYATLFKDIKADSPLGKYLLKTEASFHGKSGTINNRDELLNIFSQKFVEYKLYEENKQHLDDTRTTHRDNGSKYMLKKENPMRDGGAYKNTLLWKKIQEKTMFVGHIKDTELDKVGSEALDVYKKQFDVKMAKLGSNLKKFEEEESKELKAIGVGDFSNLNNQVAEEVKVKQSRNIKQKYDRLRENTTMESMKGLAIDYVVCYSQNPDFPGTLYAKDQLPEEFFGVKIRHNNFLAARNGKKDVSSLTIAAEKSIDISTREKFIDFGHKSDIALDKAGHAIGQSLENKMLDIQQAFKKGERAKATAGIVALVGTIAVGFVLPETYLVAMVVMPLAYHGIKGVSYAALGTIQDYIKNGEIDLSKTGKYFGKGVGYLNKEGEYQLGVLALELGVEALTGGAIRGLLNARTLMSARSVNMGKDVAKTGKIKWSAGESGTATMEQNLARNANIETVIAKEGIENSTTIATEGIGTKAMPIDKMVKGINKIADQLHKLEHSGEIAFKSVENKVHHMASANITETIEKKILGHGGEVEEVLKYIAEAPVVKSGTAEDLLNISSSGLFLTSTVALMDKYINLSPKGLVGWEEKKQKYEETMKKLDGYSVGLSDDKYIIKDESGKVVEPSNLQLEDVINAQKDMAKTVEEIDNEISRYPFGAQIDLGMKYGTASREQLAIIINTRKEQAEKLPNDASNKDKILAEIQKDIDNYTKLSSV